MIALASCGGGAGTSSLPASGGSGGSGGVTAGMDFHTALSKGLLTAACPTAATGYARCVSYFVTADLTSHQANKAAAGFRHKQDDSSGSSAVDNVFNAIPTTTFTPLNLQAAYGLTSMSAAGGAGSVVAVIEAGDDPTVEHDLSVFRATFNLPACTYANGCLRKVAQDGSANYPPLDSPWAQETSIDTQTVSAICPKCGILVVEAKGEDMIDLAAAVNEAAALGVFAISNSYAADENGSTYAALASSYSHAGIAITAASGDQAFSEGPQSPASFASVIAVGGTTLLPAADARGWTDIVWSGTGSGCSAMVAKPAWQTDAGCTMRTIGDLAFDADPATLIQTYDSTPVAGAANTNGVAAGWASGGGTSYGAPAVAAIYALSGVAVSNASALYAVPSPLTDVTSGTNDAVDAAGACIPAVGGVQGPVITDALRRTAGADWPSYLCTGVPGYDAPSGNGVPNGGFGPCALAPAGTPNPHPTENTTAPKCTS